MYICTPKGGEAENYKMANLEDYWKFLCCSHGSWFLSFSGLCIFVHLLGLQLILLSIIAANLALLLGHLTFSFFYFFGWQCCILPVWNPETEFAYLNANLVGIIIRWNSEIHWDITKEFEQPLFKIFGWGPRGFGTQSNVSKL